MKVFFFFFLKKKKNKKNKPIFTEIVLLLIGQNKVHMVKGITNAFDHMEFCLIINLTVGGKPPVIATCLLDLLLP